MTKMDNMVSEYEREKSIIQSDLLFDCIVHHAYVDVPEGVVPGMQEIGVPEDKLIHEIYQCRIGIMSAGKFDGPEPQIEKLVNEGILRKYMIPGDKRWYYRLSPVGRYSVKKMIETDGEKFNHPPLSIT